MVQIERRLVAEYVEKHWPDVRHEFNVLVGPFSALAAKAAAEGINPRIFAKNRRYADAVVYLDDATLIIEGKVEDELGSVAQLEAYKDLLPETPEMADRKDLPVRLLLVMARRSPYVERFASKKGIELDYFRPDWIIPELIKRGTLTAQEGSGPFP